ncbi:hypothetical protein [Candidatus Thalassolituus haligoni]|uniref:hypothetical protein n=1 Tax=Candidatus Thalassolituus haligoni TaxID=3100113 RepID=UPI0035168439|tara:strand:+ start:2122 stop:3081 length:960 start_codon:yes stop_codon:yes gene_type:complete
MRRSWIAGLLLLGLTLGVICDSNAEPNPVFPLWGWVNDQPVYLDEARFWQRFVNRQQGQLEKLRPDDHESLPKLNEQMASYMCQQRYLRQLASQSGIRVNEHDEQAYQQQRLQNIRRYGGGREYLMQLTRMYQSEAMHHWLFNTELLANRLFEQQYGMAGERAPADTVTKFIKRHHLVYAIWLFRPLNMEVSEVDETLTDVRRQLQGKTTAQQLATIKAWQQPFADIRLNGYPNGRLLSRHLLPSEVAQQLDQLADYGVSPVITASDGRYLLMKLPVQPQQAVNNSNQPLSYWAARQLLFRPSIEQGCVTPVLRLAAGS